MKSRRLLLRALVPGPPLVAALAAFGATLGRPGNADTLWHLALGRWLFARHALPDINRFYYSPAAAPGLDYSWLAQALLYAAWRLLGWPGIALLTALTAGFTCYFLYRLLEGESRNLLANLAVIGLALATITVYLSGRPMMFTVALLALVLHLLAAFIRSRTRLIWLIPPLAALWANLHPGFVLAPLAVLAFLPLGPTGRDRRTIAACLVATIAALIVNPHGWRIYLLPVQTAASLPALRGLTEWQGISGWQTALWGLLVALVACGLTLRRQPLPVVIIAALAALGSGISRRHLPLFGVIAVFVLGRTLLPDLAPRLMRSRILHRFDVEPAAAGGWLWTIVIPLLLAAATRLGIAPLDLELDPDRYPAAAVRHLDRHDCPDNVFVREPWSGYLLWTRPERRLFYDAKGGFSPGIQEEFRALVKPGPDWRAIADRHAIATFLLERGSPLAVLLRETPDWRREYSDSLAEIFVRAGPALPARADLGNRP